MHYMPLHIAKKISKKKQCYDESLEGDLLKAHVLYRFMTE